MTSLLLATTNPGKIRECKHALNRLALKIVTPNQVGLPPSFTVNETRSTFVQNAILKAKAFGNKTKTLTLADDSGLIVEALGGRPGVYSSRYGSNDKDRIKKLLQEMIHLTNRRAHFETVIAIYDPKNNKVATARGITRGKILHQPLGNRGFGYDPIFYSFDLHKSFAQATVAEKNRVSHRGRALAKATKILKQLTRQ